MLLTIAYIIFTIMRKRRMSRCRADVRKAFEIYQNNYSITFYHIVWKDDISKECAKDSRDLTSQLCSNKHFVKLEMATAYDPPMAMFVIYPPQIIDISNWIAYENDSLLFHSNKLEDKILNKSNELIRVLIEANLDVYYDDMPECCIKIEDYGIITAWSVDKDILYLLLETDIDHIASLAAKYLMGHYYMYKHLYINRIQSIITKGKPCIYKDNVKIASCKIPQSKKDVIAFSEATQKAASQKELVVVDQLSDVLIHPRNNWEDGMKKDEDLINLLDPIQKKVDHVLSYTFTPETNHASKRKEISEVYTEEEDDDINIKPPNVLIYTDTLAEGKNIKALLSKILNPEKYTIYQLSVSDAPKNTWIDQVALVVVCGNVIKIIADRFIEYLTRGGKVLALCSNMLRILLPSFKTAEMRENELAYFSYGNWKRVRMMHDIFCYQASPKRNFSEEHEDHEDTRTPASKFPQSISFEDSEGKSHLLNVEILGEEETWQNPSILLATLDNSGGKIIFSQIHLETDPAEYEDKEDLFETLKESNTARLEIIRDLLSTHLEMEIHHDTNGDSIKYTPAYFLSQVGCEDLKVNLFKELKEENRLDNRILELPNLKIQFYIKEEIPKMIPASKNYLPILIINLFDIFIVSLNLRIKFYPSTYFKALKTKKLGQLLIYADVLTSTMNVIDCHMTDGLAVIARQQTEGQGRYSNIWLSPVGCAMFTLQIHIPIDSTLGKKISLLQHIVAVAMISAVRDIPGYQSINLRIKWPNDIYVGKSIKTGGVMVHTRMEKSNYICNIGAGINLSNSKPTTCINDVILRYNEKHETNLKEFQLETYMAFVFNELEYLLNCVENGNMEIFHYYYYKYWLHQNANVSIIHPNGEYHNATILDIDEFGFLRVSINDPKIKQAKITVHPDKNSFDLLKGLIMPI